MRMLKRNKRLMIVGDDGRKVYVPPDFLRAKVMRPALTALAERLAAGEGIAAIIEFETALRPNPK